MKNRLAKILNWLIIVYIFLLPWQTVYIFDEKFINGFKSQLLTGQIYATEILLWLILLVYFFGSIKNYELRIKDFTLKPLNPKKLFIFSLWLFLAYSGLSIIWAQDHSAAFYLWFHFLEGTALMMIILTANVSKIKLLWTLLLSAGLQAVLAMQQFLSQTILADKWLGIASHSASTLGDIVIETASGRWLRAYGAFSHPNILGGFLLLGLIAACLLWLHYFQSPDKNLKMIERPKLSDPAAKKFLMLWLKLLAILMMAIITSAGLFFSFSRSAWLALAVILVIFFMQSKKFILIARSFRELIQFWLLPLGIILLFSAFTFIFNPLVLSRADMSNRLEIISQSERIGQINEAWAIIKTAPIFGVGLNNYTVQLNKIYPDQPAYYLQPVHNIYLLLLAELGFIGLIIFIILIFTASLSTWRQAKSFLLVTVILSFLIIGFFDHYLWTNYAGIMMFWLILIFGLKSDTL